MSLFHSNLDRCPHSYCPQSRWSGDDSDVLVVLNQQSCEHYVTTRKICSVIVYGAFFSVVTWDGLLTETADSIFTRKAFVIFWGRGLISKGC